ncbi:MAG: tetratricopeptide repeat protein [Proteobacteria bacterium]|nr:tetratricopeptide repeat protein [Pseudomonadota bacterium]
MALNVDHSEEEQVEALKRWWKEYGGSLIIGIVLGGSLIAGNKWWQQHKVSQAESGSTAYAAFLKSVEANRYDEVIKLGESLVGEHSGSSYSDLTRLILARVAFDKGDTDKAKTHLQSVLDNTHDSGVKNTARLRLARLLESAGENDKALAMITDVTGIAGFEADYAELRGDLLLAKGSRQDAKKAYEEAAKKAGNSEYSQLLKMKLANLGAG